MARLKSATGDIEEARQYWKLATERQEDESDSVAALWALSDIYKAEGDYKEAYLLNESVEERQTNLVNELITHPYTALLSNYFRTEANRKSLLLENAVRDTRVWIFVSVTLLIIIILSVNFYNYRLRWKELERELLIRDLRSLEAGVSEITVSDTDIPPGRNDDYQFMLDILKSICELSDIYGNKDAQTVDISHKIIDLFTTDENLQALEKFIDRHYDNLMSTFRRQPVVLNERQYRIAGFVFLGFSDTTIASIFHLSSSAVRQLRYRIRKKLKENPSPDTDLFLKYF